MNLVIRKMHREDLEQVCRIEQENFSKPWKYDDFFTAIQNDNHVYLVAELDDRIVGYCGMWGVVGEGQINNVSVDSLYQKRGIANQMFSVFLQEGEKIGLEEFTLEVRESNIAAITLYKKYGFVSAGIRKDFYEQPRENAVIMWKKKENS